MSQLFFFIALRPPPPFALFPCTTRFPPPRHRQEPQPQPLQYRGLSEEFSLSSRSGRRGTGRGGASVLDGLSPLRAKTVRRTSSGLTAAEGGTPSRSAIADRGA